MREYVKIYCCGDCIYYSWKKHKCNRGAHEEGNADEHFYRDCPEKIWKEEDGERDHWNADGSMMPDVNTGKESERRLVKMIAIKTGLKKMPETCDSCDWHECRPHPYKGWTDFCHLECHSLDDDQPEEWIYGGERPQACPLIEVNDEA